LGALERALERVRQSRDDVAGPLRIVGPRSTFAAVIWPVIDSFCQDYPDVLPDVQLDDSIGNWVQDRVDVGFRIGAPPQDGLIAKRLFPVQLIVCAAPVYLARHGAPQTLDDLTSHRCSVFRHPGTGQVLPWFLEVNGQVVSRDLAPTLATNDADLELQAALSGQVLAQLSSLSAAPFIRDGRLVPVLTPHITDQMGVYVYYGNRKQPARVRKFIERVVAHFRDPMPYRLSAEEMASVKKAAVWCVQP
jgi:DNA-binding transcriptional LysR family regulator